MQARLSHDQLRRHHLVAGRAALTENRARPVPHRRPMVVVCKSASPVVLEPSAFGEFFGSCGGRALSQIEREGPPSDCAALPEISILPVVRSQMLHFTNVRVRVWSSRCHRPGGWWVDGALLDTFEDRLLLMTHELHPPTRLITP